MVDAQNVSVLLLNNSVLTSMGPAIRVALMAQLQLISHTLYTCTCTSKSK
jgi:hypothetical protein